jgi:hypothetical protein
MARNSNQVVSGPGLLYVASVGTAEPTSATATLDPAFREVGYTTEGTTLKYSIKNEALMVAEEFDPIRYQTTSREGSVAFTMAQSDVQNLALALNLGPTVADTPGAGLEPPAPGTEQRVMLVLKTDFGALWIFRQCINASDLTIAFKKAPNLTTLPVEFRLEKPTGLQPFKVYGAYGTTTAAVVG